MCTRRACSFLAPRVHCTDIWVADVMVTSVAAAPGGGALLHGINSQRVFVSSRVSAAAGLLSFRLH